MTARIVFMGTPEFAVPSLEACRAVGEVVLVVTQPDKPRGRGQEVSHSPVKRSAERAGLEVVQPPKLKGASFGEFLRRYSPDVVVVTAYGKIVPPDVLQAPRKGCVNVHASLLPRFRGAAPIQWAILSGDVKTGVCLMVMDEGMDTGPVLARREVEVGPEETAEGLGQRLAQVGRELLVAELPRFLLGELAPVPQPTEGVVLAPMIRKEQGQLDFSKTALELERHVRAFVPWPSAFGFVGAERVQVHRARVGEGVGEPGQVLAVGPEGILVGCGQGALWLVEVQPEGKRRMSAADFCLGRRIQLGNLLFTSPPKA